MFSVRYLQPQPLFDTPALRIRGIGIRETMPHCFVSRPEGTGDCLLMLFHDEAEWAHGDETHPLEPGTMIIWLTDMEHHYGNRRQRWTHSWIHCDGPTVADAVTATGVACGRPLSLFNPSRIERYLLDLNEEIQGPRPADPTIVRQTLSNLIHESARPAAPNPRPLMPELLRVRDILDSRYNEKLDLTLLAREVHWSVPHLCTEFRRSFGLPPMTYLTQRRLEAACTMLRGTTLGVAEVGQRVGYEDLYHFSKLFKKHQGTSPTQFRAQTVAK